MDTYEDNDLLFKMCRNEEGEALIEYLRLNGNGEVTATCPACAWTETHSVNRLELARMLRNLADSLEKADRQLSKDA